MNLFADAHANLPGYPAAWSPDPERKYRYTLWRVFTTDKPKRIMALIGLNPSTATEFDDDPTVLRCWKRAQRMGFDAFVMLNAFAWRDTAPENMIAAIEPIGQDNDNWLVRCTSIAEVTIAAWGVHGAHLGRGEAIKQFIPNLMCLGVTKGGHPRHPLYLKNDTPLVSMPDL